MTHHLYPSPPFSPEADNMLYPSNEPAPPPAYTTVTRDHYYSNNHHSLVPATMPNRLQEESTQQTLDSLVSFYHRGQMWIDHTRAFLEDDESPGTAMQRVPVKTEADGEDMRYSELTDTGERRDLRLRKPRQIVPARRKAHNLPFDTALAASGRPGWRLKSESGGEGRANGNSTEILDMFELMLASRMESCERMNRLIRGASRYR